MNETELKNIIKTEKEDPKKNDHLFKTASDYFCLIDKIFTLKIDDKIIDEIIQIGENRGYCIEDYIDTEWLVDQYR